MGNFSKDYFGDLSRGVPFFLALLVNKRGILSSKRRSRTAATIKSAPLRCPAVGISPRKAQAMTPAKMISDMEVIEAVVPGMCLRAKENSP